MKTFIELEAEHEASVSEATEEILLQELVGKISYAEYLELVTPYDCPEHIKDGARKEREAILDAHNETYYYLKNDRYWWSLNRTTLKWLRDEDTAFIDRLRSKGYPVDEAGKMIAKKYKEEVEAVERAEKLTARRAEAERKAEAKQDGRVKRHAEIQAKALRSEIETVIRDLFASGVLNGK